MFFHGLFSYLNVFGEMVVGVDFHPVKSPDGIEGEDEIDRVGATLLPANPVIAWKTKQRGEKTLS